MAINKNFVIKNGVQVDTDLIVGDSNTKKVGIGTTVPEYTLHVGATNSAGRGGIGATDLNVTGVSTVQNLNVLGLSTFANSASVAGIVSAYSFGIGSTEVIDRGFRLSGIASLDSTTIATIEEAIRVGPNSFSDLKVSGISTFVGIATFLGGIDVNIRSGVSTFSAPVQFGFAQYDAAAGLSSNFVAVGATVGFGTSAFFRDNAAIFMGDASDFKLYHDNTNSYIDNMTGALYVRNSVDDDDNSSIIFQAKSGENSIVMTNSADESNEVELYYDGAKKLQTTSGGIQITGITTLTNRLHVQAGVSTFDADVRFGIGATVGFGTSAFFLDDAAIFLGDDSDLKLHHDGSNSYIEDVGTGDLILRGSADIKLQSASGENYLIGNDTGSLEQYFDNSKKTETTSGGFKVTGITTLTDRLHVQSGISTFDADVRYGIGATVGFGTSAFFRDDAAIFLGNDSDLKIHHDGSNSYIEDVGTGDLILKGSADIKLQSASGENYLIGNDTGSVEVYYDNSKKLESTSGGLSVTGITTFSDRINVVSGISTFQDSIKLTFGAQSDLSIWHDATNSYISNNTGELRIDSKTGERALVGIADSGVHIFYDNTKRLETISTGASVTGDLYISGDLYVSDDITYDEIAGRNLKITGVGTFYDDAPLYFGSSQDLKIWHDEDHSYIQDTTGTGNLYVDSNNLVIRNAAGNETQATFVENGAVSLYYDNSKKLESTSGGLNVTGITTFSDRINVVSGVSTFQDNAKLTFGTQADLTIWHNSSNNHSYISETGSASLVVLADDFYIQDTSTNSMIQCIEGTHVSLHYNGTNVFQTTPQGISVTGVTTSYRLNVTGISTFSSDLDINASVDISGATVLHGNVDLGNATNKTITATGRFDSPLVPSTDDARDLGDASLEWRHLFIDGTAHIDTLDVDETAFITSSLSVGTGVTAWANGNLAVAGITTVNGATLLGSSLAVAGITSLGGDVDLGNATSDTITATARFDSDLIPSTNNARDLGSDALEWKDLWLDGVAYIDSADLGTAKVADLTDNRVVIAGGSGELEDDANFTFDGAMLKVGTAATIAVNGNAAFAGIVTVGGDLNVIGDIVYDEITGRNLNITGISTQAGQANFGTSGVGATIAANGNASFSGVVTATEYYHQGTHLSAGVGIGSTTGHVGYGFTYINFKGPGVSTCYADIRAGYTGFATVTFQGGGLSGAAGTWAPYGDSGIATSKAVGVGTVGMAVTSLQGGQKGASSGIGNSFRGLYIGNGMMVVDNELNGNHYIGTSYNGLMAGPVTINGVLTVDGNYVVV